MSSVLARPSGLVQKTRQPGNWFVLAGIAGFIIAFGGWLAYLALHKEGWTLNMIDLHVYMDGGKIVRQVPGYYHANYASPLYDWHRSGKDSLQFTYTPFAAVAFALVSFLSLGTSTVVWTTLNFAALLAAVWFTLGGLGYRGVKVKVAAMLLGAAAMIWTEPVFRTIYLGQINLVLLAAILWDLCQPDARKNKGFVTGIAAGIKLIPLIFVPYLVLTRKFREAAMVCAGFACTLLVGFAVLPTDSSKYWFGRLFYNGGRTGFTGWLGNQSLDGLITRMSGSINAAKPVWLAVSVIVVIAGIGAAALLHRAGHAMPALVLTGLTGDLISPISWDHHWVWIVPGTVIAASYAVRAWQGGRRRAAYMSGAIAALIVAVFAAWPGALWGERMTDQQTFYLGVIWAPPNTSPFCSVCYYAKGDQPWFYEYHWHGLQLLSGNAYILAGLAAFLGLVLAAVVAKRPARRA